MEGDCDRRPGPRSLAPGGGRPPPLTDRAQAVDTVVHRRRARFRRDLRRGRIPLRGRGRAGHVAVGIVATPGPRAPRRSRCDALWEETLSPAVTEDPDHI